MIKLTEPQLDKLKELTDLIPKQVPVVTARAINRSADAAKTQAARSVRTVYVIKHRDVLSTMKIRRATPSNLTSDIRSRGSVMELMKFKVRPGKPDPQRKRRITVSVKKGSTKKIVGSFVAGMGSGHINVFTRVSKKRLPIRGHYGPSVPQMLGSDSVVEKVETRAMEILDTRLTHELSRLLGD